MATETFLQRSAPGECSTSGRVKRPQECFTRLLRKKYCRRRRGNGRQTILRALQDPSEVVQEALVALRKADTERLSSHLAPGLVQFGRAERQVLLVGGQPFVEDGPLANFSDVLDTGARRLLPGNLLRRCKVLSSLRITDSRFQQRVAVTACTGEEGVLAWNLEQHKGAWWVSSIQRDSAADYPLPTQPHPRHAPEAIILAQLAKLQTGDVSAAARFHVYATIPRGEDMSQRAMATLLQGDAFLPIMGHTQIRGTLLYMLDSKQQDRRCDSKASMKSSAPILGIPGNFRWTVRRPFHRLAGKGTSQTHALLGKQVDLGASALPRGREFVQEVSVTAQARRAFRKGLFPPETGASASGEPTELVRQSFIWTLGLRDCGSWLVQTVEAVLPAL